MKKPYIIAVAIHNDSACRREMEHAVKLCQSLKSFKLYFVFAVSQNTPTMIPYMHHMTNSYNMEIHEESKKELKELVTFLEDVVGDRVEFEFVKLEKPLDVGEILVEFANDVQPNLFVVGTQVSSSLTKVVLGSTSEYCIQHMPCPVTVINSNSLK